MNEIVKSLRDCYAALATTAEGSDEFFKAIEVTKEELEKFLLQQSSVEAPACGLSRMQIEYRIKSLELLRTGKLMTSAFFTGFSEDINTIETFTRRVESTEQFNLALTEMFQTLDEKYTVFKYCQSLATPKMDESLHKLWIAFSALPDDEQARWLGKSSSN